MLRERLGRQGWRVITPELSTTDKVQLGWGSYSEREQTRILAALHKQLHIRRPLVVVGYAAAYVTAVRLVARYPRLVSRLVLCWPPLLPANLQGGASDHVPNRSPELLTRFSRQLRLMSVQTQLLWRLARRVGGLKLSPGGWLPFERSLDNTIIDRETYRTLSRITVPTDIVQAEANSGVIRMELEQMFKGSSHIALRFVTGQGELTTQSARYIAKLLGG